MAFAVSDKHSFTISSKSQPTVDVKLKELFYYYNTLLAEQKVGSYRK
jgi:hypothetical protein